MRELTITPDRGWYLPGQTVKLQVTAPGGLADGGLSASVSHLNREVATLTEKLGSDGVAVLEWVPPIDTPRGYGVDLHLVGPGDKILRTASTAFDVLQHWTDRPRYGFATDFGAGRSPKPALDALAPFHINVLQFYDWQYRHDQLVSPGTEYRDPLGRALSLDTIRGFITEAQDRGIATMAYAAVYASSLEFQESHLAWALYDDEGSPLVFAGFLGYMDPTPGRPWCDHLIAQCGRALDELGFDGIHLDQYGEPRRSFDVRGAAVDLETAFSGFINELKHTRPHAAVTLNAVKNWPAHELATSREDFYYVEMWSDQPTYADLRRVVGQARQTSLGKPVIVAVYIPAERAANVLMADACILATGGSRIELGEDARLLTDPYFPKHQGLPAPLASRLRIYWDVAVRYGDLLFESDLDAGSHLTIEPLSGIEAIPYRNSGWLGLSVLNQVEGGRWDQPHPSPVLREELELRLRTRHQVTRAFVVNPDGADARAMELDWKSTNEGGIVRIPVLHTWVLLLFEEAA